MKNKTKSEIVIEMNNIDNANRLFEFLKTALHEASCGGDFELSYDREPRVFIGHDVRHKSINHVITKK